MQQLNCLRATKCAGRGVALFLLLTSLACHHANSAGSASRKAASKTSKVSYLADAISNGHELPKAKIDSLISIRNSVTFCKSFDGVAGDTVSTCIPCVHAGAATVSGVALKNARDLRTYRRAAPYDNAMKTGVSPCVWRSYEEAINYSPQNRLIRAEYASFRLLSKDAPTRQVALVEIDNILDTLITAGDAKSAATVLVEHGALHVGHGAAYAGTAR